MTVKGIRTRLAVPGERLVSFVAEHVSAIPDRTILVVASKLFSFAERRLVADGDDNHLYSLVRREADSYIDPHASKYAIMLTIKGSWMFVNAGIDRSNSDGRMSLWPRDPQASCVALWSALRGRFGTRELGLVIADSGGMPLNWGVISRCIAHCGFQPLRSYVGQEDLFGRPLQMERANLAQGVAAAAGVVMGEGAERIPLALVGDVQDLVFQDRPPTEAELAALRIELQDDAFAPALQSAPWKPGGGGGGPESAAG